MVFLLALGLVSCGSIKISAVYESADGDIEEAEAISQQVMEQADAMGDEVPQGIVVSANKLPDGLKLYSNTAKVLPGYKHKVLGTIRLMPDLKSIGPYTFGMPEQPDQKDAIKKLKQIGAAAGGNFVYIISQAKVSQNEMGAIMAVAIKLDPAVLKKLKQK